MRLAILILMLIPAAAAADVRYVTDELYLGLYDRPAGDAKAGETLVSGTALEVLEQTKHYARVRTPDGAEGWVKSAYLVEEKPPRLVVAQLRQEKDALDRHLATTLQELEAAQRERERLAAELQAATDRLAEQDQRLGSLEADNQRHRARLDSTGLQIPAAWAGLGALFALALGGFVTQRVIDFRVRRRHGGFRVY